MKKTDILTYTAAVLCIGMATGCSSVPSGSENLPKVQSAPMYDAAHATEIQVTRGTGEPILGLGVEFDPHFIAQNTTRNDGATVSDWDQVIAPRVKKMQIQRFRVMLLPHWWEPYNDNDDPLVADPDGFDFNTLEMQSVYKVLDLAEETGTDVTLVLWGCPTSCELVNSSYGYIGRHFLCAPGSANWVTEPADEREFAESFSAVVSHLINEKGYTCIKEITPYNEPDGNVTPLEHYIPLVKELDRRLTADGIRDKVQFNLSDNTDTRRFFLEGCAENLAEEADLFNSHTYIFGYDTPNSVVIEWEKANIAAAAKAGKRHFVGEFGSDQCVGATRQKDIDRYERGVLMTRHVLNFLNAGAAGASYWSLLDQYYNKGAAYPEMQQLGLWYAVRAAYTPDPDLYASIREDYQVRPQYYSYSLLTRFIRKGDKVYPIDLDNEFAAASAFLDEEGRWTYIFANGSDKALDLNLSNPSCPRMGQYAVYRYEQDRLPKDDSLINPDMVLKARDGKLKIHIPSQAVMVLTQK